MDTERTARVVLCEILRSEPPRFEQAYSQGIAHYKLGGSTAGGGEVIGTGFLLNRGPHHEICLLG